MRFWSEERAEGEACMKRLQSGRLKYLTIVSPLSASGLQRQPFHIFRFPIVLSSPLYQSLSTAHKNVER